MNPFVCLLKASATLSFILTLGLVHCAHAQIVEDSTLPSSSEVTTEGNRSVIRGGTQRGANLFHSFREFSVPTGGAASFQDVSPEIINLFSRVTGSTISNIDGLIEVLDANGRISGANVFLLNPNGIIFGPNASLNIGGSFIASTANQVNFADGTQFSAANPQAAPLLTISVPIGLQFGPNPSRIVNRSAVPLFNRTGNPVTDPFGDPVKGLRVAADRTLALVGGPIRLQEGGVIAGGEEAEPGGRIELGSIAQAGTVRLMPITEGWRLGYDDIQNFGAIQLVGNNQPASLYTSGSGGGTIRIQGGPVLASFASIFADTLGAQNGRAIAIQASRLRLDNTSVISASTSGLGRGGDIRIQTDQLLVRDASQIETNTFAEGQGGNLSVSASDAIEFVGGFAGDDETSFSPSGFFTRSYDTGQGGNSSIVTNTLRILAGAQVSTTAFGTGNTGNLAVRATTIELNGVGASANGEPIISRGVPASPSGLIAGTAPDSTGQGSNLTLVTQRLTLQDGAVVQTSTLGDGAAGRLDIQADVIDVSGTAIGNLFPSGILSVSGGLPGTDYAGFPEATGRGGDLSISTNELIVRDRAVVATGSLNSTANAQGAGNLTVTARSLSLENQAGILANTASGQGGEINLQIQDNLLLRQNSTVSTTAGLEQSGGDGGDITINADFIIAAPSENSDITANAFTGTGGNINITARGVIGIEPRSQTTNLSDITASSELGLPGTIQINTPDVDPSQGLVELPADVVDAAGLIAQTCSTSEPIAENPISEFVITGRGGLPPSPTDRRSSDVIQTDWVMLPDDGAPAIEPTTAIAPTTAIVEAQGWVVGETGEVVLVAHAPTERDGVILSSEC